MADSEGEEEVGGGSGGSGKLSGTQHLVVDDDLREMAKKAAWSVSSCKPGNGVLFLRDDNLDTYWQFVLSIQLLPYLFLGNFDVFD